jgi:ADP-ribose pyrophosphatase
MTNDARPRRLRGSVVFQGRVFRIERDVVRLSHGGTATLDIVRHRGSVVLIPRPAPGRVILIRQFRYALNRWIWELPAGSLEKGERPGIAARRECEEEIGLTPRRVRPLATLYPTPGFCDEKMIFYLCDGLTPPAGPVTRDEDEQIEPRTFTMAQAKALVARGGIVDMKTVLGLVLLERSTVARRRRSGGKDRAGKRRG